MPLTSSMTGLAAQKRLLVEEAHLHRTRLRVESANVRTQWFWLRKTTEQLRVFSPWLALGGLAAGIMAARKIPNPAQLISLALAAVRWLRRNCG